MTDRSARAALDHARAVLSSENVVTLDEYAGAMLLAQAQALVSVAASLETIAAEMKYQRRSKGVA